MNGDIKNLFRFIGLLALVAFGWLLIFFYFNIAWYVFDDLSSTSQMLGNPPLPILFSILATFFAITYYPLRFLPPQNKMEGVYDLTLYLVFFPIFINYALYFLLTVLSVIFWTNRLRYPTGIIMILSFLVIYIISYRNIMKIEHAKRAREKDKV